MVIYLGADHRGFGLKELFGEFLREHGYEVVDLGNDKYDENDDYPDFAEKVAGRVSYDKEDGKGVLICGSGVGVDVVANKFRGVRSVLGISTDQVRAARLDDDANVLSLAANFTNEEEAKKMLEVFLTTKFSGEERHSRRLQKISKIEK